MIMNVVSWFKRKISMWLAYWTADNDLASDLEENRSF